MRVSAGNKFYVKSLNESVNSFTHHSVMSNPIDYVHLPSSAAKYPTLPISGAHVRVNSNMKPRVHTQMPSAKKNKGSKQEEQHKRGKLEANSMLNPSSHFVNNAVEQT